MKWICGKCSKEFEFHSGCKISYEETTCADCHLKDLEEFKQKQEQTKLAIFNFKPFFDQSLGVYIDSYSKKKEIEKKEGVEYMSNDERLSATKEAQRKIRDNKRYKNIKAIKEIFSNVQKGHSYIRTLEKRMRQNG